MMSERHLKAIREARKNAMQGESDPPGGTIQDITEVVMMHGLDLLEVMHSIPRYDVWGSCVKCGEDPGHPRRIYPDCPVARYEELTR